MPKRCTICGEEAEFCLKNTSAFYCKDCAKENFSDLELLQKLGEQAAALKRELEGKEEAEEAADGQEQQ